MKINKDVLTEISQGQPSKEGVLFFKHNENGFKERWFKICSNMLFIYPEKDGQTSQPINGFLMENFEVFIHKEMPNKFSFYFLAEPDVKYSFFCLNSRQTNEWFEALNDLSYRKQRKHLNTLRSQLKEMTGVDPLESTPWVDKI